VRFVFHVAHLLHDCSLHLVHCDRRSARFSHPQRLQVRRIGLAFAELQSLEAQPMHDVRIMRARARRLPWNRTRSRRACGRGSARPSCQPGCDHSGVSRVAPGCGSWGCGAHPSNFLTDQLQLGSRYDFIRYAVTSAVAGAAADGDASTFRLSSKLRDAVTEMGSPTVSLHSPSSSRVSSVTFSAWVALIDTVAFPCTWQQARSGDRSLRRHARVERGLSHARLSVGIQKYSASASASLLKALGDRGAAATSPKDFQSEVSSSLKSSCVPLVNGRHAVTISAAGKSSVCKFCDSSLLSRRSPGPCGAGSCLQQPFALS
jgi:hypothetical protein